MRIIGGQFKGRRLRSPRWDGLRPTSDQLRETLFNLMGHRLADARVLDAFAGTGALGLEALSRGAAAVVFVERDRRAVRLIAQNLEVCGVVSQAEIICGSLPGAQKRIRTDFDIILADPPYAQLRVDTILSALVGQLRPGGVLVHERARRTPSPSVPGLHLVRTVTAGDSALDLYEHDKGDTGS